MSVRLEWDGKPTHVERLSLPFQTVETINESRATRDRDAGSLLRSEAADTACRNLLIWGDNKLVMSSLLEEFAGAVRLIYIDPPAKPGDAPNPVEAMLGPRVTRNAEAASAAELFDGIAAHERLLVIHTNQTGEIVKADLQPDSRRQRAREALRPVPRSGH